MRFTILWLKQFLDTNATIEEIAHTLTMTGLEVEDVDNRQEELNAFTVAEIVETIAHPEANKLKICKVNTGSKILQIVCGAPNARGGIKVALAQVGAIIPNGKLKIKKSRIRNIESCGMLCSADELNIGSHSSGIIELPDNAIIGEHIAKYFGLDDPVIHINITPNRADSLGVYGIARDLAASGIGKLKPLKIPKINTTFKSNITLAINNEIACPFFAIREIKNIDNKERPTWLKNYLQNIGLKSISPIVDITNYISYTFGQPMHAYDKSKIKDKLIVETLDDLTKFKALNEKEYELIKEDLIIRDTKEIHCLAGIIGSHKSSCTINTTSIILEAASFNPNFITSSGRRLNIDTDSRYRFERNVDREFTLNALDYATNLITSICGGEASEVIYKGNNKLPVQTLEFPLNFFKSRTSLEIDKETIISILSKLGFKCVLNQEIINIEIPSWRYDVSIKEDIVEEIIRIYGYDKLPQVPLPNANRSKVIPYYQRRISDIKRLLATNGYTEIVSWSFMDSKIAQLFASLNEELIIANPISSDLNYMRPSILPNLIKIVHNNINRSFKDLSLFEIGPIFEDTNDNNLITSVAGIRTGLTVPKNNYGTSRLFDVFDIKADIELILNHFGLNINKCQIKNNALSYFYPTKSASLTLGKKIISYFGQIHPTILKQFNINSDIMAFELLISKLPIGKEKFGKKTELISSDYQMVIRDYAFIVDINQPVGEILEAIRNIDRKLIKAVSLFDLYYGDKIQSGEKSIAISISIQDNSKTLSEEDIDALDKSILLMMNQKFSALLRDGNINH